MHGSVAAGGPAGTPRHQRRVVHLAKDQRAGRAALHLRVAFEAEIVVRLEQHLAVRGTVRMMTGRAALAHGLVLEDERPGLVPMALGAGFIVTGHGQPAGWFVNLPPVWIVTLHAVHPAFDDRMMLREVELGVDFKVAVEARGGISARIEDESSASR